MKRNLLLGVCALLAAGAAYALYITSRVTTTTIEVPKQDGWTTHVVLRAGNQLENLTIRYEGGDDEAIRVSSEDWDEVVTSKFPHRNFWFSHAWYARLTWGPSDGSHITLTIEMRPAALWILPWAWRDCLDACQIVTPPGLAVLPAPLSRLTQLSRKHLGNHPVRFCCEDPR